MFFPKTYFLCSTSDLILPPPTGPLCLGSIIRSTSTPQQPLNSGSVVAVSNAYPPMVETDWKKTVSTAKGYGLGLDAYSDQLAARKVSVNLTLNTKWRQTTTETFEFDTMTTLTFEPTQGYVQEAIKAPAVQAWLREPKQRFAPVCSLYLVTSLKLVKGATIMYSASKCATVTRNIAIDMPPSATTSSPEGPSEGRNDVEGEVKYETEFVFAFRVKRLRFGWKPKIEDYNKGAFLAVGGESEGGPYVVVENVDDSDDTAEEVPDLIEDGSGNGVTA